MRCYWKLASSAMFPMNWKARWGWGRFKPSPGRPPLENPDFRSWKKMLRPRASSWLQEKPPGCGRELRPRKDSGKASCIPRRSRNCSPAVNCKTKRFERLFPREARRDVTCVEGVSGAHRVRSGFQLNGKLSPTLCAFPDADLIIAATDHFARASVCTMARQFFRFGWTENLCEFLMSCEDKVGTLDEWQN